MHKNRSKYCINVVQRQSLAPEAYSWEDNSSTTPRQDHKKPDLHSSVPNVPAAKAFFTS